MTRAVGPSPMRTMPGRPSARKTIAAPAMSLGRVPRAPSMATGSCSAYQPRRPKPVRAAPAAPGWPSSARYMAVLPRRFMTTTAARMAVGMATMTAYQRHQPPNAEADADDDSGGADGREEHPPPDVGVERLDGGVRLADLRDAAGLLLGLVGHGRSSSWIGGSGPAGCRGRGSGYGACRAGHQRRGLLAGGVARGRLEVGEVLGDRPAPPVHRGRPEAAGPVGAADEGARP